MANEIKKKKKKTKIKKIIDSKFLNPLRSLILGIEIMIEQNSANAGTVDGENERVQIISGCWIRSHIRPLLFKSAHPLLSHRYNSLFKARTRRDLIIQQTRL